MNVVPLGDILMPAPPVRAGSRDYPLLSMTMKGGLVDPTTKFNKRVASEDTSEYKVVREGQLVVGFPIDEGVLSFQRIHDEAIVSPAYGIWDLKSEDLVCRSYLEMFLKSPQAISYYLAKLRSTTARRRSLDRAAFLDLPTPLPPLEEQKRIAAILDQADALRRLRRRALDRLNTLGQAIFHEMFGGQSKAECNWQTVALADLVPAHDRINYGVVQPGDHDPKGVPIIRVGDLLTPVVDFADIKRVSRAIDKNYSRSRLKGGEILVGCVGSIGTTIIAPASFAGANIARAVARIPLNSDLCHPQFICHQLRSHRVQDYFKKEIRLVAQPTLNIKQIREVEILLPPFDLQRRFARRIDELQKATTLGGSALKNSERLFTSLQHRAFRGEL